MKRLTSTLASVLCAAAITTGCGATTSSVAPSADTTADSADSASPPPTYALQLGDAFEGIYVDDSSIITPLANGVIEVDTGRPCESFRQGVLGSDAALVGDFTFPSVGMLGQPPEPSGFLVAIDTRLIYIETVPQTEVIGCIARLYSGVRSDDTLPGSTNATPGYWSITSRCFASPDGSYSLSNYLLTSDGYGAQVLFTITGTDATRTVTIESAVAGNGPDGFLSLWADAMGAMMNDPSLWGSEEIPPGILPDGATVGELPISPTGTATLTTPDGAIAGTVQVDGFAFPFACADMR